MYVCIKINVTNVCAQYIHNSYVLLNAATKLLTAIIKGNQLKQFSAVT